jgi:anaphase-promoting complex subunit 2
LCAAFRVRCAPSPQRRIRRGALPAFWARFSGMAAAAAALAAEAPPPGCAQPRADVGGSLDCAVPRVYSRPEMAWVEGALTEGLEELCGALRVARARADAVAAALERGAPACAAPAPAHAHATPPSRALRAGLDAALQAALLSSAECPFGEVLAVYYGQRLAEFAAARGRPNRDDADEADDAEGEQEEAGDEDGGTGGGGEDDMDTAGGGGGGGGDAMEVAECGAGGADGAWRARVCRVTASLAALGLAPLAEEAVAAALAAAVRSRLTHAARGVFDTPALAPARAWLAAVPLPFLAALLPALSPHAASLPTWRARLEYALCTALGALRCDELFDIVVDFPDSRPALHDLAACLATTSLAASLAASFRDALARRLLHAGAATSDILAQYVSAIKALRALDPSGLILEAVSEPIRAYLRGRRDTIRCVVTALTDSDAAGADVSLMEELAADAGGAGGQGGDAGGGGEDYDSDVEGDAPPAAGWDAWAPPPVHADAAAAAAAGGAVASQSRRSDVVSLLVGIFGSRELFIAEYRAALAERLLRGRGYDTERDVRTLELLKLRFGEAALHSAEVMLKDVADSKRTDGNVKAAGGGDAAAAVAAGAVCATIISQLFWPPFGADAALQFALPRRVAATLEAYGARFEALKAPRKLLWRPALGSVSLELRLGGETRAFSVSPLHAALVARFGGRDAWHAAELAAALRIAPQLLRQKVALWVNAGVLREERDRLGDTLYTVADAFGDDDAAAGAGGGAAPGGEDGGGAVASAEEQAAAEMAVYEQYVIGMLTNFDALSAERIHNMLKMFVSEPPYDKSAAQLEAFLARLVAEEKLTLDAGSYRRRAA